MTAAPLQEKGTKDFAYGPEEAWPFYADDEIEAVASVLRSGKVNQWTGPHVLAFEQACTDKFGGGYGIAVANGSVALDLALLALEIGPGDEVVVTPRTFVASAFCVMLAGATPVFADVDPDSGNITPATIQAVLTERTRAIIPVHLAGWPADMPGIMRLAQSRGLKVVEDCAQAHGALIEGQSIGSFGDAAAFSFCQDKIISTGGEGGFVSFRGSDAADWARSFKDHGKNWEKVRAPAGLPGEFRWLHDQVGTNWRLTGPQAAIGLKQLEKLEEWVAIRTRNARVWTEALSGLQAIRVPHPSEGLSHAFYKLYFQLNVPEGDASRVRQEILRRASEEGIRLFSGSCSEVYLEEAFGDLPRPDCPVARRLGQTSLMVEVHPTLRQDRLERRAEKLRAIIEDVVV
jgi:dTDP-4-amino-4,6-dideoxygalactose transaminase